MFGKKNQSQSGLTLIEIIIAVGILTIVAGLGLIVDLNFYQRYSLDSERDAIVAILRKSRSLSMTNFNRQPYGVFIESNRYTAFRGNSYANRQQTYDQIFNISPSVGLRGLQEIVFNQLSGDSNASGTIVLSSGAIDRTISINYEGQINW